MCQLFVTTNGMIQTNLKLDMVRKMQNDSENWVTHPSVELPDAGHITILQMKWVKWLVHGSSDHMGLDNPPIISR